MPTDIRGPTLDCNCLAIRQAARHVTQFYDHHLAASGLRTTQFSILAKLRRLEPMTINALAADMVMDRTTLGRNILPLERDGLIVARRDARDRRAKALHLTKAGAERLHGAVKRWAAAQSGFEVAFGPERAAELRRLLRTVVALDFEPAAGAAQARPH
jgi:DNA-binding MarR family transcriptional regulator